MNVATAKLADLNDLRDLIREYQEEINDSEAREDKQIDAYIKDLIKTDKHGTIFLGKTSSGTPVGFLTVYLTPTTIDAERIPALIDLFIRPAQRENGFGRQLFDHTIRWAKRNKYPRIICTVENMNMAAQYLFEPFDAYSAGWVHYSLDLTKSE